MEQLQVPCLLFSCGRLMLSYVCVVSVCVSVCLCRPGHVAHDEGRGRPLSKREHISPRKAPGEHLGADVVEEIE